MIILVKKQDYPFNLKRGTVSHSSPFLSFPPYAKRPVMIKDFGVPYRSLHWWWHFNHMFASVLSGFGASSSPIVTCHCSVASACLGSGGAQSEEVPAGVPWAPGRGAEGITLGVRFTHRGGHWLSQTCGIRVLAGQHWLEWPVQ